MKKEYFLLLRLVKMLYICMCVCLCVLVLVVVFSCRYFRLSVVRLVDVRSHLFSPFALLFAANLIKLMHVMGHNKALALKEYNLN